MSRETLSYLNINTLIGFTEKRGNAWHYRKEEQGTEGNHYVGAIPLADVERRLFHWDAQSGPVQTSILTEDGVQFFEDKERQVIVRPDNGAVLGVFKSGYKIHSYKEWLLNNVATILDDNLSIGSAGLLKRGAVAWVQVEVPDSITTPEGVEFRPNLLACTSLDGSLATTYKRNVTAVVCDNTLSIGLGEKGQQYKVKHSSRSLSKVVEARDALQIVHSIGQEFSAEVQYLCETTVTDKQWGAFLDAHLPIDPEPGRSRTIALNKQDVFRNLWKSDPRVSPWKNTAFGVLQAANTFTQHLGTVKGTTRSERNALSALDGTVDKHDSGVLALLDKVLASV